MKIDDSYEIKVEGSVIKITVKKLYDRVTNREEGDLQVKSILGKVFEILESNPDKNYYILGDMREDDLTSDLGDTKQYLEKLFRSPQISAIAVKISNSGAINLMNILASMIFNKTDTKIQFFNDYESASNWIKSLNTQE